MNRWFGEGDCSGTEPPTIAARLTPAGRGGIATVVVDGPHATECVAALFRGHGGTPLTALTIGQIAVGCFGPPPGEEIVVCRRTADRVELHCHGGEAAVTVILDRLVASGCQTCEWQHWIERAASDTVAKTIAAEALTALAAAQTTCTADVLLAQYHGALATAVHWLSERIVDEDSARLDAVRMHLEDLIARYEWGRHLTVPWRIVIAGHPNVGKSSLLNRLVGYERALVFDQPGTTRDVIWSATAIEGWPVELADTAGLRAGAGDVESRGIERARAQMTTADLIVLVHDASHPVTDDDLSLRGDWPNALLVANKIDLTDAADAQRIRASAELLATSALTGEGIDRLLATIAARLRPAIDESPHAWHPRAVPFTLRQVACLESAAAALGRQRIGEATAAFERLLGGGDGSGC
ncbi:MAG: 50S ribosome-binding GTPase [Planctomycetales bacterium]|nr:50S ribosome-binding GTPase [Planctomycetales bacterium]